MYVWPHLFDGCIQGQLVGFFLRLTKHDGSAVSAAVNLDDVADHGGALWPVASNGQMLEEQGRDERLNWILINFPLLNRRSNNLFWQKMRENRF